MSFKLGMSYWSFKDGPTNTHPITDALEESKHAGLSAIELAIGTEGILTVESSEEECNTIRQQIDSSGIHCSSLASGLSWCNNPVSNNPEVRQRSNALTEACLQRAAWLGCDSLLYVPGVVGCPFIPDEKVRYDHALERCKENLARLLKTAELVGVDLLLENVWNGFLLSPAELASLVDEMGSDRLGVYFDVGNVLGYHQNPAHWIEMLSQRIKRVHVKGFKHEFGSPGTYDFCGLQDSDVDWHSVVAALNHLGYDNTIIAEMMPPSEHLVEKTAIELKAIFCDSKPDAASEVSNSAFA